MLQLNLLGPVEAWADGKLAALAPLERSLLALLALPAGSLVSTERIIDGLWGDHPPAAPRSRVQSLVSVLRRKTGNGLVTRNPGYLLEPADVATDVDRCAELARQAQQTDSPDDRAALLRQAVGLWRGEPLDGVEAPGTTPSKVRLAELRVSLLEDYFDAELGRGEHANLVAELVAATAAHPLRERLTGQLMLALFRSNRQAEALRAYTELRDRLAEELGSDPCADLRTLYMNILRGQVPQREGSDGPPPEQRPAQMPASVGHFVGRDAELAALSEALPAPDDEPRMLLVSGAGGLGKTALAVRWAHAVADRFPDGQILVDLRGSRDGTLSPAAALRSVLLALGSADDQLPTGLDERTALFRTLMHGKHLLLVCDDAASVEQLLPLVPPTSGSLVVATSRGRLPALTAHHAVYTVIVDPLTTAASRELLSAIVGQERLRGDGAAEVVRLCGGWPLAIRLAGATLAARSKQSLSSFTDELRERVDVLSVPYDSRTVRAALAQAHDGLRPAARHLFAQLGVLPVTSMSLQLAAAVAGVSTLRARQLLDELISANLVIETAPDRYRSHDMIRRYARRCGAGLADRTIVEERAIRWYLATLQAVVDGGAGDVLTDEAANLRAVVRWAASRGNPALTCQLVAAAFDAGAALPVAAYEAALEAEKRLVDRGAALTLTVAAAHARLGIALVDDPARRADAAGHLAAATEHFDCDQGPLPAVASFALGYLCGETGRPAEGRAFLERTLSHLDPAQEPISYAIALLGCADAAGASHAGGLRFAQALILCEATAGIRFEHDCGALDPPVVAGFLRYVARCAHAPRVTVTDRLLAEKLLRVCYAIGVERVQVALSRIPQQRAAQPMQAATV